ncbi:AraC family transcriptional regulator [Mesorhizobium sanjuanii]
MQHHLEAPLTICRLAEPKQTAGRAPLPLRTPGGLHTVTARSCPPSLQRTNKSISVIALECCFCDGSHLSPVFRNYYGQTPQALPVSE